MLELFDFGFDFLAADALDDGIIEPWFASDPVPLLVTDEPVPPVVPPIEPLDDDPPVMPEEPEEPDIEPPEDEPPEDEPPEDDPPDDEPPMDDDPVAPAVPGVGDAPLCVGDVPAPEEPAPAPDPEPAPEPWAWTALPITMAAATAAVSVRYFSEEGLIMMISFEKPASAGGGLNKQRSRETAALVMAEQPFQQQAQRPPGSQPAHAKKVAWADFQFKGGGVRCSSAVRPAPCRMCPPGDVLAA